MRVAARIFHPRPSPEAGPLSAWLQTAKAGLAQRHAAGFANAGADAQLVHGLDAGQSFGARLREVVSDLHGFDGLVVLGSGALVLARAADLGRFVQAAQHPGFALTNNRFSADIVAVGGLRPLASVPDLRTDNALPRWLEEARGYRVADLRRRWQLGVDLDSPIDIVICRIDGPRGAAPVPEGVDLRAVRERLAAVAKVTTEATAEVLIAGRTSPTALSWLERRAACRVRAFVEERGLRAGSDGSWAGNADRPGSRRLGAPASVLGALLDTEEPASFGRILARLADGAVIDTRVLLAHRLGRDEGAWPSPEDRFASDLLLPGQVADPWLRELTQAALEAPLPVILGGHTLVGPGLRLALASRRPQRAQRPSGAPCRSARGRCDPS